MLTQQRHDLILQLLQEKGSITISDIREQLDISESTIRRDLNQLDAEGKLVKVFGGAVLAEDSNLDMQELPVSQKGQVNVVEKRTIGQYAASMIRPDDFVYIDAGTTTEAMLDFITLKEVTYVTNGVSHARRLAIRGFHVILIGGELKGTTEAIIGAQAVQSLAEFHFTKGFFGTNGVSTKYGFTTPDHNEAQVKKMAVNHCRMKYVLADASKLGVVSAVTFCEFDRAQVITDTVLTEEFQSYGNILVAK